MLADTLGAMLEEWRLRLEQNKPSFPLGAARWGVLQMCIYDMWCTMEEARIWDIGLSETERLMHSHSPPLAAMLGRLRTRLSQSFATTLSMSQRLQFELQRWHAQWLEASEGMRKADADASASNARVQQLQSRVHSLEEELSLHEAVRQAARGEPVPLEQRCARLQQENARLQSQLRHANAAHASIRARELSMKLTNEGLLDELARWRASLGEGAYADTPVAPHHAPAPPAAAADSADGSGTLADAPAISPVELQPLLSLFASYPVEAQRVALASISQVHAKLTGSESSLAPEPRSSRPARHAGSPASAIDGFALPARGAGGDAPSPRVAALQELAVSLTEEEARALAVAIKGRSRGVDPS